MPPLLANIGDAGVIDCAHRSGKIGLNVLIVVVTRSDHRFGDANLPTFQFVPAFSLYHASSLAHSIWREKKTPNEAQSGHSKLTSKRPRCSAHRGLFENAQNGPRAPRATGRWAIPALERAGMMVGLGGEGFEARETELPLRS